MNPVSPHLEAPEPKLRSEPSLAQLVGKLSDDFQQLARSEAQLAKHELGESLDRAKQQLAAQAIGGAAAGAGVLLLLAALVLGLATVMAAWLSALLVGGALCALGVVLFLNARARFARVTLAPKQTLEGVQKDLSAIKKAAT